MDRVGAIYRPMKRVSIDPSPRTYPDAITLLRRRKANIGQVLAHDTVEALGDWLLDHAINEQDLMVLFDKLCWRLAATDIPVDRISLHVGTLHPQIRGFGWGWRRSDGITDEFMVDHAVTATEVFQKSPLYMVITEGKVFEGRPDDPELSARYPLLAELAAEGLRHYIAAPLSANGRFHNAITLATSAQEGFTQEQVDALRRIGRPLALLVDRHIVNRISRNVLDVYLGSIAGKKVLTGSTARGDGDTLRAIIWSSDMRGFTNVADSLPSPDVLALLNAYFERVAGAVSDHGGEILKYMGDGLLAVFPLVEGEDASQIAQESLNAALQARAAIADLNAAPPEELKSVFALGPVRSGIALHEGEVFFGNMGAPDRLDFTVIGRAVNGEPRRSTDQDTGPRPADHPARGVTAQRTAGRSRRSQSARTGFADAPVQPFASGRSLNSTSTK
jgi:adenylate cyclase